MLHPVPMVHLRIQVGNRDASAVTRRIAQEGLLHLVDLAHGRVAVETAPPGSRELLAAYRDLAHRAERLAERLGVRLAEPAGELEGRETPDLERERAAIEAALGPLEAALAELWRTRAAARDRLERARETVARSARVRGAGIDLGRVLALRFTALRVGEATVEELGTLASLLSPAPFAVVPLEADGPTLLAAVALPAGDRARLENALRVVSFREVSLPASASEWETERLEREIREGTEDERRIEADLATQAEAAVAVLEDVSRRAQVGALLLQAQTFFAAAGRFVVISGWVPEESAQRMRAAILEKTGGRAVIDIERPEDLPEVASGALAVPILHRNPILLRPFQKLIQIYGTPSYQELEPTAFFAVSFLLMFGLMFGDVGHGAALFLAGYCLFRWIPRYLDYGILLMEGGTAAAVFGFLYGSFFGIEGALPVLWMEPMKDLPRFLSVAVGLGVALVSIGLVLNVVNTWRAGDRSLALFGPRGLFGAFGYWVIAAVVLRAALARDVRLPGDRGPRGGPDPASRFQAADRRSARARAARSPERRGRGAAAAQGPRGLGGARGLNGHVLRQHDLLLADRGLRPRARGRVSRALRARRHALAREGRRHAVRRVPRRGQRRDHLSRGAHRVGAGPAPGVLRVLRQVLPGRRRAVPAVDAARERGKPGSFRDTRPKHAQRIALRRQREKHPCPANSPGLELSRSPVAKRPPRPKAT
jgi:V/A-type H+-transporting ATPase subunit I